MARQFCLNNADMRITCLRLSNVMAQEEYAQFESWQNDPAIRQWNMWTYVDVRDVAQAIEKAVEYDVRGKDEFFITSDVTCMRTPHRNFWTATIQMLNSVKILQVMSQHSAAKRQCASWDIARRTAGPIACDAHAPTFATGLHMAGYPFNRRII